ncbi:asparaginase [Leptothrix discophora]|uniref:Asparaginase n=1 Tax=Leptothrix discophora TaxID=89 RepID=A0ABT9G182_LEPDI|nr:asparaginase [Leptothrix discophora]MDP4300249.1 asparaginase [Leptothrix discophora]
MSEGTEARDAGATRGVVVLGTGGTISGKAGDAHDNVGYSAGLVGVGDLVDGVPGLDTRVAAGLRLEVEQVAQVDSKDMSHAVWRRIAERAAFHLNREDVAGVVITHGTDTLEETAYLLQRVLAPSKPLVLTAAMRPASSSEADGPTNLRHAIELACLPEARGVLAVVAGTVWAGHEVRKVHPYRTDAFSAGDAGAIGYLEEGRMRRLRDWPTGEPLGLAVLAAEIWPEVQIVVSHGGADGRLVDLLLDAGVQGIVVACTGNGTVHDDLRASLMRAAREGVAVLRALRHGSGVILPGSVESLPSAEGLTPAQARVELLLRLLATMHRA